MMAVKKPFIPEAEPAVIFINGRKTIIDNHVASKYDYRISEYREGGLRGVLERDARLQGWKTPPRP